MSARGIGYDPKTDAVLYGPYAVLRTFSNGEMVRLALALLDQASISPKDLATAYGHARGDRDRTIGELDLDPIEQADTSKPDDPRYVPWDEEPRDCLGLALHGRTLDNEESGR